MSAGTAEQPTFTSTPCRFRRLRDVSGQRQNPSPQASVSALSLLVRRLGLLALAIFVVVMHHVVGAHAHEDAMSGMPSADLSAMTDPAAHSPGAGSTSANELRDVSAIGPVSGVVEMAGHLSGSQVSAVVEPGAEPGMLAMLHLCLAVLAAAVLIAALFLAAIAFVPLSTVKVGRAGSPSEFPRPAPSQRRLAHLQVLRL